ncbi:type II secretion system F family protein [Halanaerocella petrolearia]
MEAESKKIAVNQLREQGYYITSIEEETSNFDFNFEFLTWKKASVEELALFSRQFATMINSGLSLVRTLNILSEQVVASKLKDSIIAIRERVESGMTLSEAMIKEDKVFPKLFITMVEAGETGGILDGVLEELAQYFEKENDLKQKITSALVYPIVITLVALGVVFFLITVVLPTFVDVFSSMDIELPLLTRLLLYGSSLVSSYWYLFILVLVVIIVSIYYYYQTDQGKRKIDGILLKLPLWGDLVVKVSVARISRTLSILINSGISILEGLEVVSKVVSNQVIADKLASARQSISEGESITLPLSEDDTFPEMALQMIEIGEETGNLEEMLNKLADFYEQEVEYKVDSIISLVEPALIVVLGIIIGGIVLSIMLPMFGLIQSV